MDGFNAMTRRTKWALGALSEAELDSGNAIVPTAYVNDAFSSNTVIADPELSLPKIKPEIGAYVSPAPSERATFANSRPSTAGRTRARSRAPQAGEALEAPEDCVATLPTPKGGGFFGARAAAARGYVSLKLN